MNAAPERVPAREVIAAALADSSGAVQLLAALDYMPIGQLVDAVMDRLAEHGYVVVYDEDCHLITLHPSGWDGGWSISHPLRCRAADEPTSCEVSRAARAAARPGTRWAGGGVYECDADKGLLVLLARRDDYTDPADAQG